MKPLEDAEVAAWIAKAGGDLRMARYAVAVDDPLFDQACFHAQQTAEKALKALAVALGLQLPRTHDLLVLLDVICAVLPDVRILDAEAELLSNYSVGPRYPSFLAAETEEESWSAVHCCTTVLDWVVNRLGAG